MNRRKLAGLKGWKKFFRKNKIRVDFNKVPVYVWHKKKIFLPNSIIKEQKHSWELNRFQKLLQENRHYIIDIPPYVGVCDGFVTKGSAEVPLVACILFCLKEYSLFNVWPKFLSHPCHFVLNGTEITLSVKHFGVRGKYLHLERA